jgi:hypothetical protein
VTPDARAATATMPSMVAYFGEPWDAPVIDDAVRAPTPVGEQCIYCPDTIAEGDQGLIYGAHTDKGGHLAPAHRECVVRSVLGSVQHLQGRCICFGGTVDESDQFRWGTFREQGRASMEWLARHGRIT